MGAAYGLAKLTAKSPPTPCARGVWCAIVAAVAFFGLVVLIDLEVHLRPAPLSKTPAISRFSRQARSRFRLCAKRREIAARLGRMKVKRSLVKFCRARYAKVLSWSVEGGRNGSRSI